VARQNIMAKECDKGNCSPHGSQEREKKKKKQEKERT
jgi:hypothetical protein